MQPGHHRPDRYAGYLGDHAVAELVQLSQNDRLAPLQRKGCDQLVETISGWLYVPTGNLFDAEQVQPSRDRHCHVCLGHGNHRSICAFIVPNV